MGTYYHTLGTRDGRPLPERVICLGVSADVQPIRHRRGRYLHSCNAWHATVIGRRGGVYTITREEHGSSAAELLSVLSSNVLSGGRTIIVAADIEYTFRLAGIFRLCSESEICISEWYSGKSTDHITLQIGERMVSCVGLENYINLPVQIVQKHVGDIQEVHDGAGVHCQSPGNVAADRARRVAVAISGIFYWVHAYARYCWAETVAGISWSLYRSRKWGKRVRIHGNAEATSLERRALRGIQAQCFCRGRYPGTVYVLDVNSAYAHAMATKRFPVRLHRTGILSKLQLYDYDSHNYGFVGRIHHCEEGMGYAATQMDALSRDMPGIEGVYCGDELLEQACYRTSNILCESAVYEMDRPFSQFVRYIYDARRLSRYSGNGVGAALSKAVLCTFFGRWAMKSTRWEDYPDYKGNVDWGFAYSYDKPRKGLNTICVLGGKAKVRLPSEEWKHSFPLVSAYVTMYARKHLEELFDVAGRENVLYTDTDSLHVTNLGHDSLCRAGCIHQTQLGKLKVVTTSDDAEYFGPKAYRVGSKYVVSGMAGNAYRDKDGRWITTKRSTLLHGAERGPIDSVTVVETPFTLGEEVPG